MRHVAPELLESWGDKDPVSRCEARLADELGLDAGGLRREVGEVIETAVRAALDTPMPDPGGEDEDVFYDGSRGELSVGRGDAPWSGFRAI